MSDDPWTIYWQADNRDSCIASASPKDAEEIGRLWQRFAANLSNDSNVLDLATGNGAVPLAMLAGNDSLRITGVDLAEIDPLRFLSAPGLLDAVTFIGNVDVCSLPFDDSSFDAVTSQFGIEYAALDRALAESARVLGNGGKIKFLMHHDDSDIVAPARQKLREMESILRPGGVIERLGEFMNGGTGFSELDAAGREHLDAGAGRTAGVTGQVFEGVNQVIKSVRRGDSSTADDLANSMTMRLRADRSRLAQLVDAALTRSEVESVGDLLRRQGVEVETLSPCYLQADTDQQALVGWHLQGAKTGGPVAE